MSIPFLQELDDDVLIYLFGFLPVEDMLHLRQVSISAITGSPSFITSCTDLTTTLNYIKASHRMEASIPDTYRRPRIPIP